uniref:Uncharacterized protein n=1 Tax=Anguilla anguilla TaxID=7936 RepID=A0A0E9QCJ3_ANGAN
MADDDLIIFRRTNLINLSLCAFFPPEKKVLIMSPLLKKRKN